VSDIDAAMWHVSWVSAEGPGMLYTNDAISVAERLVAAERSMWLPLWGQCRLLMSLVHDDEDVILAVVDALAQIENVISPA
jgi:hypothetical protein